MAGTGDGLREAPSWTLVSIRSAFIQAAAERVTKRAGHLADLGADVKPLKGFQSINRLDLRARKEPSIVWGHLDEMESSLREYDVYLDNCEKRLAENASRERATSTLRAGRTRPGP